jgi:hypothetical protein
MNANQSMTGGFSEYPFPNQNTYSDARYQMSDTPQYQATAAQYPMTNVYAAGAYYDDPVQQAWSDGFSNQSQYTPIPHSSTHQDSPSTVSSASTPANKSVEDDEVAPMPKKRGRKKKVISEAEKAIKREHFLERNRVAAGKCRQGKKVQIQSLVEREKELRAMNTMLVLEVEGLREDRERWMQDYKHHMESCHSGEREPETPRAHSLVGPSFETAQRGGRGSIVSSSQSVSSPDSGGDASMSRSQSVQSTQLTELSLPDVNAKLKGGFDSMFAHNLDDMEMGDYFEFPACPSPHS